MLKAHYVLEFKQRVDWKSVSRFKEVFVFGVLLVRGREAKEFILKFNTRRSLYSINDDQSQT